MTPSLTDHRSSWPTQPSRSLPLKSLIVSDLPARGRTIGASFLPFSSAGTAALHTSSTRGREDRAARRRVCLMRGGTGGGLWRAGERGPDVEDRGWDRGGQRDNA